MKTLILSLTIVVVVVVSILVLALVNVSTDHRHLFIDRTGVECRLPDPLTEYRVIIQRRDSPDRLSEECSIEPRDNNEGSRKTMKRLLKRGTSA